MEVEGWRRSMLRSYGSRYRGELDDPSYPLSRGGKQRHLERLVTTRRLGGMREPRGSDTALLSRGSAPRLTFTDRGPASFPGSLLLQQLRLDGRGD